VNVHTNKQNLHIWYLFYALFSKDSYDLISLGFDSRIFITPDIMILLSCLGLLGKTSQ
jgi:hypothetical protein